ncbi:phosphoribosylamine--glycine ligase [Microbacterium sp. X-17]|uniref:phosphoribosylamine--glycine ligase n=1 Tax=Microbacterium sp. X-17 TaxID=3144404 RepID=UPI0031F4ADCA
MRILVLGSGAREHAVILALRSEEVSHEIFAAPGNAGIARDAELVDLDPLDPVAVTEFAKEHAVDLVVIGPEAPLVAGVADAVRERGIPVFGPGKAAARLEGSKAFAKHVMDAAGVPTGRALHAASLDAVAEALDELGAPYVVKADGLASGKGVIVTPDREAALAHAAAYLPNGPVLVEEFLDGPEVSLFFLSDGDRVLPLSPAQDYKRLRDADEGPNTGGMGAYSPLPWLADRFGSEEAFVDLVSREVAEPVVRHLDAAGTPFVGLLYAGLVLTATGVKVIEFNARFGDPETQVVLPRLREPLSGLLLAAASGTLEDHARATFRDDAAVVVVLASEGYPERPVVGRPLRGLADAEAIEGVHIAHAATATDGADLVSTGGRVLGVVGTGADLEESRARAYRALELIELEGGQYRRDIAALQ